MRCSFAPGIVAAGCLAAASLAQAAPSDDPAFLGKHFRLTTFWERGPPDDHNHRSNVEGTEFEANTRQIAFVAETDLSVGDLPILDHRRCAVSSGPKEFRMFEVGTLQEGRKVSLVGWIGPPPGGRWATGRYLFFCATPKGPYIRRVFTIK